MTKLMLIHKWRRKLLNFKSWIFCYVFWTYQLDQFVWRTGLVFIAGIFLASMPFIYIYRPFENPHAQKSREGKMAIKSETPAISSPDLNENKSLLSSSFSFETSGENISKKPAIDLSLLGNTLFILFAISDLFMSFGLKFKKLRQYSFSRLKVVNYKQFDSIHDFFFLTFHRIYHPNLIFTGTCSKFKLFY